MKNIQLVLNTILSKEMFHYFQIDRDFNIVSYSYGVEKYLSNLDESHHIMGSDVREYLPELVGSEEEISTLFWIFNSSFELHTVNKNEYYIDISIQYCGSQTLLIIIQDNTNSVLSQQKLLQSNNEFTLLQNTLQKVFDRQNSLMFVSQGAEIKFVNQKFIAYFGKKTLQEFQDATIKLYKYYDEDFESYDDIYKRLLDKVGYMNIGSDDFMIQVSSLDRIHRLFTLSAIHN